MVTRTRLMTIALLSTGIAAGLAPVAHAATTPAPTTTVTVIPAAGEIHYCKGIYLTALAGTYTRTRTETPKADGTVRVTSETIVSSPVYFTGSDSRTYVMRDLARSTWVDVVIGTDGVPVGTVANSWKYDLDSTSGWGTMKQTVALNADGSMTYKYGGSCGQVPGMPRIGAL